MALKTTPEGIEGVGVSEHSSSPATKSSVSLDTGPAQVDFGSVAPKSLLQDIRQRMPSRSIGNVELDGQMIGDMLEEYYAHFHESLPILPHLAELMSCADDSPLLFWTVMGIPLRTKVEHRACYFRLAHLVHGLASEAVYPAKQDLSIVQALLLLCCWPLPHGSTKDDPSHTYVALATQIALKHGLHRPQHAAEFGHSASLDDRDVALRRRIWIACFVLNQWVTAQNGVPSSARLDQSILEATTRRPPWLPDRLYFQLLMAVQHYHICNTLGNNELTSSGMLANPSPSVRLFEHELNVHETRFSESWKTSDHIHFLGCKLSLYIFALSADPAPPNSEIVECEPRSRWLPPAYKSAVKCIALMSSFGDELVFTSIHLRRCLINAILFLLRIMLYSAPPVADAATVRNRIHQGWDIIRSCSLASNDHMSRVCAIIEYLSTSVEPHGSYEAETFSTVRSRMAGNLGVDSILRARDRFSQAVKDQRPMDYTQAATAEGAQELVSQSNIQQATTWLIDEDPSNFDFDWTGLPLDSWLSEI